MSDPDLSVTEAPCKKCGRRRVIRVAGADRAVALSSRGLARYIHRMRALCVARHRMLSEHFCRFFDAFGVDTVACVGWSETLDAVRANQPDTVICDYDLLASIPDGAWEVDPAARDVPVIAVSLTRQPSDMNVLDASGAAGFLYLPTLSSDEAHRVLAAIPRRRGSINPPNALPWPAPTPAAHLH